MRLAVKFNLKSAFAFVAFVAVSTFALVHPVSWLGMALASLIILAFLVSPIIALYGDRNRRSFYVSALIVGWLYLVINYSGRSFSPTTPITFFQNCLGSRLHPKTFGPVFEPDGGFILRCHSVVFHSIVAILLACLGGILGMYLDEKHDQPKDND